MFNISTRSDQLKNNSRCLKSTPSLHVPSFMDDIEEVIYSQGEPYPKDPCEDRSWDSDDNFTSDNKPTNMLRMDLIQLLTMKDLRHHSRVTAKNWNTIPLMRLKRLIMVLLL